MEGLSPEEELTKARKQLFDGRSTVSVYCSACEQWMPDTQEFLRHLPEYPHKKAVKAAYPRERAKARRDNNHHQPLAGNDQPLAGEGKFSWKATTSRWRGGCDRNSLNQLMPGMKAACRTSSEQFGAPESPIACLFPAKDKASRWLWDFKPMMWATGRHIN